MSTKQKNKLGKFLKAYAFGFILILLVIVFGLTLPNFFTSSNIMDILRSASIAALIALGFTCVLVVNEFDLSVAATAGLSSMVVCILMVLAEFPAPLAIVISLLIGMGIGAINAFLTIILKISSLLGTLGMLFLIQGIELTTAGGQSIHSHMYISTPDGMVTAPGAISDAFNFIGQGYLSVVPIPVIIMLVVAILLAIFLHYTTTGRFMYATGSNKGAARACGIKTRKIILLAFLLSGLLASLGGIVLAARLGMGQVLAGQAFFLPSVAAAFIGTTVGTSGKPNPIGTLIGAITIAVILNGLTMLNVPYTAQDIFIGVVLLVALVIGNLGAKK